MVITMVPPPPRACRADAIPTTQALSDGRAASSIYGAEHLLRLFVKLPELMAVAVATEQQAANVAAMVQVGLTSGSLRLTWNLVEGSGSGRSLTC